VKIELGSIRNYWNEAVNHTEHPHVPLIIIGKL